MKIRNKKLYDFIVKNYIKAKKPMSQIEIADEFGMSIGAVKNFMFRHNLNKRAYYAERNDNIKKLYIAGINVETIAKAVQTTKQNVYNVLSN